MRIILILVFFSINVLAQTVAPVSYGGTGITSAKFRASGAFTGGNIDLGSAAQAAYIEMTNASLTFTPDSGSAAIATMCSSTNAATAPSTGATTCAAGSESNGVTFTILRTGLHEVCVEFDVYAQSSAATALNISDNFQLIETPTNAQTQTTNTKSLTWGVKVQAPASGDSLFANHQTMCRNFNFSSTGQKGVRLMYSMAAATVAASSHLILSDNTSNRSIFWSVEEL